MNDTIIGQGTLSGEEAADFIKFLNGKLNGKGKDEGLPHDVQVLRLQEAFRQLQDTHQFELGDLVQVKPALYGNFNFPAPGQPAVIAKIHNPPLVSASADSSDADFGRQYDVSVRVCRDDRIVEYPYSSELLEPYQGE